MRPAAIAGTSSDASRTPSTSVAAVDACRSPDVSPPARRSRPAPRLHLLPGTARVQDASAGSARSAQLHLPAPDGAARRGVRASSPSTHLFATEPRPARGRARVRRHRLPHPRRRGAVRRARSNAGPRAAATAATRAGCAAPASGCASGRRPRWSPSPARRREPSRSRRRGRGVDGDCRLLADRRRRPTRGGRRAPAQRSVPAGRSARPAPAGAGSACRSRAPRRLPRARRLPGAARAPSSSGRPA